MRAWVSIRMISELSLLTIFLVCVCVRVRAGSLHIIGGRECVIVRA